MEIHSDDSDSDDDAAERPCPLAALEVPLGEGEQDDEHEARVTIAEVALRMLDWMGEHKSTWESAADVWEMLTSILPKVPTRQVVID